MANPEIPKQNPAEFVEATTANPELLNRDDELCLDEFDSFCVGEENQSEAMHAFFGQIEEAEKTSNA
jgi:hypothetical protein